MHLNVIFVLIVITFDLPISAINIRRVKMCLIVMFCFIVITFDLPISVR